jgi:hypothetical protein
MPSGGVNIENIQEWIKNGAFAIGIGSALVKQGRDKIKEVTKEYIKKAQL